MSNTKLLNASVLALMLTAPAFTAHAQLDEIIVTAQKKSESLQDVPIAVTAFNAELLQEAGIIEVEEIALRTPNFTSTRFNIGEPQFYIRGVGSTSDSASGDPSVALFVDEVYVGRAAGGTTDLFDLESVEVLRGPQGTLYGRNAAGGAININTRKPSADPFAEASFTYGRFNLFQGKGVVNGPLGASTNGKLSVNYRRVDGFVDALAVEGFTGITNGVADGTVVDTGQTHQDQESFNVRAQLAAEAGDADFLLSLDYANETQTGNGRVALPGGVTAATINIAQRGTTSVRQSFSNPDTTFQDNEVFGVSLRVDYELSDSLEFTSLSAYRENEYDFADDLAGLPPPTLIDNLNSVQQESDQFSQEFRLAFDNAGPITWLGGLYFFTEDVLRNEQFDITGGPILQPDGTPINLASPVTNLALLTGPSSFIQDANQQSYAAFGQVNWDINEALKLTVGGRISHDVKSVIQSADGDTFLNNITGANQGGIPLFPGSPFGPVTGSDTFTEPTWRVALDWQVDDSKLLYLSYDRGYKSGGFVAQTQSAEQAQTPLLSEIVDSFEFGAKTRWLDDRLQLNLAAFYSTYDDLQIFELIGLSLNTSNADAEIFGVEIETSAAVTDNFEIGGTYSYLNSEFTSDAVGPVGTTLVNGNNLIRAPENKFGVYGEYAVDLGAGELSLRADYNWSDEFFYAPSNGENSIQPSFGVLNGRVAYDINDNYEISVWGKNLTDEEYTLSIIPFAGSGFAVFAPPTTYGVTLNARFD